MRIPWKALIAGVLLIGVLAWAYDTVRTRSYNGTDLTFELGGGSTVLFNNADNAAEARLSSTGSRGAFTIRSSSADTPITSAREGSGRNLRHVAVVPLPPGSTELVITRGGSITAQATSVAPLEVTVTPQSQTTTTTTLVFAFIVAAACLFYIVYSTADLWRRFIRRDGGEPGATYSGSYADGA